MAKKKADPAPMLAYCPFCRDGGKPRYTAGEESGVIDCLACGVSIMRHHSENVIEIWNTRFFLTSPDKMAAYSALVRIAALRAQWVATIATTISKKKIAASRDAFLSACAIFIDEHGGIIRSALNDMETADPPKKKGRKAKK